MQNVSLETRLQEGSSVRRSSLVNVTTSIPLTKFCDSHRFLQLNKQATHHVFSLCVVMIEVFTIRRFIGSTLPPLS